MDILAARKKAAERAKAGRKGLPEPARQAPEEQGLEDERLPAFPPIPETGAAPDEAALREREAQRPEESPSIRSPLPKTGSLPEAAVPGQDAAPAMPAGPASTAQISFQPVTGTPDAPEEAWDEGSDEQQETEREQEREMLAFLLGSEEYVVPVEEVQEVLTPREITPIPHSADHILGVCSLRGIVLPIIDLHRRLGLAEAAWDERSRILVANLGPDDRIGLYVDRVRGVVRLLPSAVRPVPESIERGAEFLQGIARKDDRLFILLDIKKTTDI